MLKIIQIVFIVFSFNVSAYAVEIKLECNVSVKRENGSGSVENDRGNLSLLISEVEKIIFIDMTSSLEYLNGNVITNVKTDDKLTIDSSNENKWDILVVFEKIDKDGEKAKIKTRLIIDRQSGFVSYVRNTQWPNYFINTFASGNCKKIDKTKKKF